MAWSEWKNVSSDLTIGVSYTASPSGGSFGNGFDNYWSEVLYTNTNYKTLTASLSGSLTWYDGEKYFNSVPILNISGTKNDNTNVTLWSSASAPSVLNIEDYKTVTLYVRFKDSTSQYVKQISYSHVEGSITLS